MTDLIINGLAFKAIGARVKFEILGDEKDWKALSLSTGDDACFRTEKGTSGTIRILSMEQAPSLSNPGLSKIEIVAGLRLED